MVVKNPNSKGDASNRRNLSNWSELPPDLIHSVFKRLSFQEFEKAKSVCSPWYSASKHSFSKNEIPWMIIFPYHGDDRCKLLNPEDNKVYTSRDLGSGFAQSMCVATYGCWLLMQEQFSFSNLYILNLLTGQRISLPPLESLRRLVANSYAFSIDEEAKDYLVTCSLRNRDVVICKKGDNLWGQIPEIGECRDVVYKDHKLYVCGNDGAIRISDFSGEVPRKAPETDVYVDPFSWKLYRFLPQLRVFILQRTKIVVTVSGEVLMVSRIMDIWKRWSIRIYGMNRWTDKWERVVSLGEEAMLLDLGITVLAKDIPGINTNSVYFSGFGPDHKNMYIFDLDTRKIQRPCESLLSSLEYSASRWFFPGFSRSK